MKAILVIEIPNDIDISKTRIGGDGNIYYIRDGEKASIVGNIRNIKPMPNRIKERGKWISEEYQNGWNACVGVIEK